MFGGPPEGSEVTWNTARLSYRIVDDDDLESLSPVVGHTMVEYKGSLIVWGGYYRGRDSLFRYRPSTFLYILPSEMFASHPSVKWIIYHVPYGNVPPSTSGACSTLCRNKLCVFGGYSKRSNADQGHSSEMYLLDLHSETWSKADVSDSRLPTPRDKMVGWQYKGRCYYFGGYGPRPDDLPNRTRYFAEFGDFIADEEYNFYWNNQLIVYNPDLNSVSKWTVVRCGGGVPSARAASSCTYLDKYTSVLLFGGRSRAARLNDLYMLEMNSLVWTKIELLGESPEGRTWCSLKALSSADALLYGGYNNSAHALDDMWRISIVEDPFCGIKVCGGADSFMEHVSCLQGTLKISVQPPSLFSISFAAVCREANLKTSLLHSHLRLVYEWARFIQTYGCDGSPPSALNTEKSFGHLKLTQILNLCSLGG